MKPDEPDPPRKFYEFKPREFEKVNRPGGSTDADAPISVNDHLRQAAARPSAPAAARTPVSGKAAPVANDVHAMLRENLEKANAAGLNELAAKPKRRSRRKRDYWILMIVGNAALVVMFISAVASSNAFLMGSAAAGIGLLSAVATWVMWFVMDDY